jgi:hypothetical protein
MSVTLLFCMSPARNARILRAPWGGLLVCVGRSQLPLITRKLHIMKMICDIHLLSQEWRRPVASQRRASGETGFLRGVQNILCCQSTTFCWLQWIPFFACEWWPSSPLTRPLIDLLFHFMALRTESYFQRHASPEIVSQTTPDPNGLAGQMPDFGC